MAIYFPPTKNGTQKTLDSQLDSGVTSSMTLNNTTSIQNKPGVVLINRIDSNGAELPASSREYIAYTGVSGSTLTGLTRNVDASSSDNDHAVGSIVEFVPDVIWAQAVMDALQKTVDSNGNLDATKVVPATYLDTDGTLAANSDSKVATQKATKTYSDTKISKPGSEAQGDILYHNGSAWTRLAAGTSGYFLKTQGASSNPIWAQPTASYDKARVRLSGDVSLTASTPTKITFDTEDYDTGSRFASNKFTVGTAGYYRIFAQVHFYNGSTTSANFTVFIYKNGSSVSSANIAGNGVIGNSCAVNDVLYLAANDYIECYATAPAANWLAYAETTLTHMNIEQITAE